MARFGKAPFVFLFLTLGVLFHIGCSTRDDSRRLLPAPVEPDGGVYDFSSPLPGPDRSCRESTLTDFWNCGSCGAVCPTTDSDRCVDGVCQCGENTVCGSGSDCRQGRCVDTDPSGKICEFDDECRTGYGCIEAHCSFVQCSPYEDCDGYDNDCDGLVDEGSSPGMPLSTFCYEGSTTPDLMSIMEPCRAGVQVCASGEWSECLSEISPVEEVGLLACDGQDNNCDGCPDGEFVGGECVPYTYEGFDILYVIDTSGSMNEEIDAAIEATRSFSASLDRPDMRFSLVVLPGRGLLNTRAVAIQDFTDFTTFETSLSDVSRNASGSEANWDALYEAMTGETPIWSCSTTDGERTCADTGAVGLSWRARSIHIIVLFTDEGGQSYRSRRTDPSGASLMNVNEADVCSVKTRGEVVVTMNQTRFHGDFDDCGMTTMELTGDAVAMASALSTVLVDPCSSGVLSP